MLDHQPGPSLSSSSSNASDACEPGRPDLEGTSVELDWVGLARVDSRSAHQPRRMLPTDRSVLLGPAARARLAARPPTSTGAGHEPAEPSWAFFGVAPSSIASAVARAPVAPPAVVSAREAQDLMAARVEASGLRAATAQAAALTSPPAATTPPGVPSIPAAPPVGGLPVLPAPPSVLELPVLPDPPDPGRRVPRAPVTTWIDSGYAAVAATVVPTRPGVFTTDPVLHLARRATFGPRPGDLDDIRTQGIDGWISRQLLPETIVDAVADQAWGLFPLAGASRDEIHAALPSHSWDAEWMTAQATLARQVLSQRQLYEQVVDVMTAHLHVAMPCEAWDTAPSYPMQVIRPYALGRYRDMLLAAMRHPAMLQYLDNDSSSPRVGDEHLGRLLLEQHTVGASAGYSEADVTASATVLSGRSVADGRFAYQPESHRTGPVSVLGWSSANGTAAGGLHVGDDYLTYLAEHPSTARTIALKLAVRFVSDEPPASLVDRMAAAYLSHDTDLRAVLDCLFRSPEFWASTGQQSRRPLEDVVGAARVLDMRPGPGTRTVIETLFWVVRAASDPVVWDPPGGYPGVAAACDDAGGLITRWTLYRALVNDWWQGMTVTPLLDLAPVGPGTTAGEWIDALSRRLLGQTMTTDRRDAIVAMAGIGPSDPADLASAHAWTLIPLVLDTPYFRLR